MSALPWQAVVMAASARIHLDVAGVDTLALSTLCGACPQGPRGCCAAPPVFTWSDIARILGHGGRDWLRAATEARRLLPNPRGLAVARVEGEGGARCAFHGARGCTLEPTRRSTTCNDYLCDDALATARANPRRWPALRRVHRELAASYALGQEIGAAIGLPCWDGAAGEEAMLATIAAHAHSVRASLRAPAG